VLDIYRARLHLWDDSEMTAVQTHRIPRGYRLAGGVEADPGLVGQPGDPLGPNTTGS
jgi:hypothetical protein